MKHLVEAQSLGWLTEEEFRDEIKRRLDAGGPMHSIVLKLRENGLDMFEHLNTASAVQGEAGSYMLEQKIRWYIRCGGPSESQGPLPPR